MMVPKWKVIIVGGGFAGINCARQLAKDKRFQVTLADKNNYHFFPPLLYQVSTAFIETSSICYPFRRMFKEQDNVFFHMGALLSVDTTGKTITTETAVLSYDFLILALGTESNYFGLKNVERFAMPMKTIDDAVNLRNRLLLNMEAAANTTDVTEKEKYLNIVIAGGGPTGVEVAGMLAEMGSKIATKEYPEIKSMGMHIYLVNSGAVLLGPMSKTAQSKSLEVLTKLGVHIVLDTAVEDYDGDQVQLEGGKLIPTKLLIWASGVRAREVPGLPATVIARGRRIMVDELNRVQGMENIFAIGDICVQTADKNYPQGHPQLAQVAIQQGTLLADNLKKLVDAQPARPFVYHDKGSMAIISKYEAVADLPKFSFTGFFAWVVWLFIHIMPLVGFRSKVEIAFSWLWSFVTNDPTLRLIIRPEKKNAEVGKANAEVMNKV